MLNDTIARVTDRIRERSADRRAGITSPVAPAHSAVRAIAPDGVDRIVEVAYRRFRRSWVSRNASAAACASSPQLPNRSCGCLAIARATTLSNAAGSAAERPPRNAQIDSAR